jgi:hypothetical protein
MGRKLIKVTAATAVAVVAASAAQAAGPTDESPPDPGFAGVPHCTVPAVRGVRLAIAKRKIAGARCVVGLVARKRSSVKRGRVISATPRAGTQLAAGSQVDLLVSRGR